MATYSTLKTATKEHCSIASANTAFDTHIGRWLNDGQADFASEVNWKFLEARASIDSSTYKFKYPLIDGCDVVKSVTWEHDHHLKPVNHDQWIRLNLSQSVGTPKYYIVLGGSLHITPQPDSSAATTTLSATASAGSTDSLRLTVLIGEEKGRVKIGDEVIEYAYTNSTDTALLTTIRGAEGTTPAAHSSGDAVTYMNIEYDYYKVLADMSGDDDTSSIPTRYHRALPLYAAAQYFYKIEERTQGDSFMARYIALKEQAKRDLSERQSQKFSSVLDDTQVDYPAITDNLYPDDGSLSYE